MHATIGLDWIVAAVVVVKAVYGTMSVWWVADACDSSVPDGWEFSSVETCLKCQHYCAAASSTDDESMYAVYFVVTYRSVWKSHLLG